MTRVWLENHPMKKDIVTMLGKHFAPSIVKDFIFLFEAEIYDAPNILNQVKDDKLIMEIRYKTGKDTSEYICDVFNWMTKDQAEFKILRYTTDAYKSGKIGHDWTQNKGKIAKGVSEGKYVTPLQEDEFQNSKTGRDK